MIKITVVSPYKEFADLFIEVFEKHQHRSDKPEYENEKYELEILHYPGFIEVKNVEFNTDVIISRGGMAFHFRKREKFTPFVEVPVAGHDLIHSLHACKEQYGNETIAVVGPTNMSLGAERLSYVLGMNIKTFLLNNEYDLKKVVRSVVGQGINIIVGGVKTCEYGNELGANTLVIKSGFESIWQAITEAKRVAYISRTEKEKAQQYKMIIDYAYEGIIATDSQNKISVFNSVAKNTLGINESNIIGKPIEEVISNHRLKDLLAAKAKHLFELVKYNDIQLNINKVPIMYKGQNAGNVLTFQEITRIQDMEGKIRQKIYARGHIAKHSFENIIGQSIKIKEAIRTAKKFSMVDSNILIFGETGTGKELFAQSIHNYSSRKGGSFVAINCAALPENLLESELFGYVEGAFTGAAKGGKPGLFELAHGGTIFLDEISEISLKVQSRLLRVLQEKEIMRLGHDRVVPVDVRVVSATNKDLNTLVKKGEFREDLYYRLDVLKICLPSLRERKSDVPDIAKSFIKSCQFKHGKQEITILDSAIQALQGYEWPGNVRQLENICERLVVLSEDDTIGADDVYNVLPKEDIAELHSGAEEVCNLYGRNFSFKDELKSIEKNRIIDALEKTEYNKSKAARLLGINRSMLWRRMAALKIEGLGKKE